MKRVIWLLAAAAILASGYGLLVPWIDRRRELLASQRQWLEMSRAADKFAVLDGWRTHAGGFSQEHDQSTDSGASSLRDAYGLPDTGFNHPGTLFLHARRSEGERERLVVVEIITPMPVRHVNFAQTSPEYLDIDWYTRTAADWLTGPSNPRSGVATVARPPMPATGEIVFFCGQPDAKDPARFTIPFRMDSVPGAIEGRLLPDGTVAFKVTSGPLGIVSTAIKPGTGKHAAE